MGSLLTGAQLSCEAPCTPGLGSGGGLVAPRTRHEVKTGSLVVLIVAAAPVNFLAVQVVSGGHGHYDMKIVF